MAEYEINEEPGFEGHGGVREAGDPEKAVDAYVRDAWKTSWGESLVLYVRERGTRDVVRIRVHVRAIVTLDVRTEHAGNWSGR